MDVKVAKDTAKVAFILTSLLVFLKLFGGVVFNSTILVADGIHSLADLIPLLLSMLSYYLLAKKGNEQFPYGFFKLENLLVLVVSILFIYTGWNIILEALNEEDRQATIPQITIAVLSLIINLAIFYIEEQGAKKSKLKSLELITKETFFDVFSTFLILASLSLSYFGFGIVEKITTGIIGLFIIKIGVEEGYKSILDLLDANDVEKAKKIKEILEKEGFDVEKIYIRTAGPVKFLEIKIKTHKLLTNIKEKKIKENIEKRIREFEEDIAGIFVEFVFKEKNSLKVAVANKVFGKSKYFYIYEIKDGKIKSKKKVENPCLERETRVGLCVAKFLKSIGVEAVFVEEIGDVAYQKLISEGIRIYKIKDSVEETARLLNEGKILPLEKATKERI